MAYSTWRLATGWKVRGSKPDKEKIESFLQPSIPALSPTQRSFQRILGIFSRSKVDGTWN